jgi:hypothetical protein
MEDPTGTDEVSLPAENTRNGPRTTGVIHRKVGTKALHWAAAAEDEGIPAAKKPRLETSISTAADVGLAVAEQTTDTLATASTSDIVAIAPRDAVTVVPSPLQSTEAPRAPRRSWKPEEDAKLTSAVKKHGGNNWTVVATLVPGRTNRQCLQRWADNLDPNSNRKMSKWTAEEDAKQVEGVHKHGTDWVAVSKLVSGRTNVQCCHRRVDGLDPDVGRGPRRTSWKPEEDAKLTSAVKRCGKDWVAVAALVPGRTNLQCRERWANCLDPGIERVVGKWTAEEDAKLIEGVQKHEKDWVAVSKLVPGRTNAQCCHRWVDCLDHGVDRGPRRSWKPEEDAKLTSAVKKHGSNNWIAVAKLVPGRTNLQCRLKWINSLDPSINRTIGTWTTEEDAKLIDAIGKCGKDWVAVAKLVPGRTNKQCRTAWIAWVARLGNTKKGTWTAEEDSKLIDAVRKCGKEDWDAVAAMVPSRTSFQCRTIWTVRLGPAIEGTPPNLGRWTPEEDAKLTGAVMKYGKDWVTVAPLVPGRTNLQCRQRWVRYLDPPIDRTPETTGFWTAKEDAKLTSAMEKHGKNWVAVAVLVPGRTNLQCRKRWQVRRDL